jgi:broad specificity phosphatase PhoE
VPPDVEQLTVAALYLVRHGQASFGTDDYDRLSSLGVRQAQRAGQYLQAITGRTVRIVSGSLVRHRDTAAQIAREGVPIQVDERFNELDLEALIAQLVSSLQDADGTLATLVSEASSSRSSYQKLVKRVFVHWQALSEPAHPLESWSMFASRVSAALADLVSTSRPGETTVVVTSGGVIAALVQQVLALPAQSAYGLLEAQMNCSITCLLHDRKRVSLSSFNESAYLVRTAASDEDPISLLTYR